MEDKNLKSIKEQLITTIDKKLEDRILEESNATLIKKLINYAEDIKEAVFIAALGTTYNITGFQFDKRLDKVENTNHIKFFKKNTELSFKSDSEDESEIITHKLIIGDNYDALENLLIQYKGSIDVIYIDPPYGKDSMGQFADTNYNNAITRDNLLSMLYIRLVLAKELLSDDGVIFCSIDDRNQAYVKCLFDEVFSESNFIGNIIQRKGNAQNDAINMQKNHEYILTYSKSKPSDSIMLASFVEDEVEVLQDENGKSFIKGAGIVTGGAGGTLNKRKNLGYTIYYNKDTKDKIAIADYDIDLAIECNDEKLVYNDNLDLLNKGYIKIRPPKKGNLLGCWTWSLDKFNSNKDNIYISESLSVYKKIFIDENNIIIKKDKKYAKTNKRTKNINSIIDYSTAKGTVMLGSIIEGKVFDNAKNLEMIKFLIRSYNKDDGIIVLDFFAGSGTTGQAVLELNKEDDGNRQFILCQLNEITGTTPNGIVNDVTSKRLKRVMTGKCYDGSSDFDWIKKNEPLGGNLDVYEIDTVANNENTEGKTPFDVIDETLYGKEKFDNIEKKIEWVCQNFEHCQKEIKE